MKLTFKLLTLLLPAFSFCQVTKNDFIITDFKTPTEIGKIKKGSNKSVIKDYAIDQETYTQLDYSDKGLIKKTISDNKNTLLIRFFLFLCCAFGTNGYKDFYCAFCCFFIRVIF